MTSRTFVVGMNAIVFLLILILVCAIACAFHLKAIRNDIVCIHPATDAARIFVYECMGEGYEFGPCYNAWVNSQGHGSVDTGDADCNYLNRADWNSSCVEVTRIGREARTNS